MVTRVRDGDRHQARRHRSQETRQHLKLRAMDRRTHGVIIEKWPQDQTATAAAGMFLKNPALFTKQLPGVLTSRLVQFNRIPNRIRWISVRH
jgi:hypothetical protein